MKIIRTTAVELTTIPAIAYKQKLRTGGSGVKIIRLDQNAYAVVTLDKRTQEPIPYKPFDEQLFPEEAFDEAIDLTLGLPYSSRGNIILSYNDDSNTEEDVVEVEPTKIDMVDSPEYFAITEYYSDHRGKMNYKLMNRDFIKFAAKSKVVSNMIADGKSTDDVMVFVVKSRASNLANLRESLDDEHTVALMRTLDEIDPRSAFKDLRLYINRMQGRNKKR